MSSGVAAVLHHDVADNAEHPPLFKVLAALPVLAVASGRPRRRSLERQQRADLQRPLRRRADAGGHDARASPSPHASCRCSSARCWRWPSTRWPRLLFGPWSGVVAALLWLLDPVVLGLGHLDGVDLPFALTTVLVSLALVRWLRRRDRRAVVWLGWPPARRWLGAGHRAVGGRPGHRDHGRCPVARAGHVGWHPGQAGRCRDRAGLGRGLGRLHRARSRRRWLHLVGGPSPALRRRPAFLGPATTPEARPGSCSGIAGRGPTSGSGRPHCWSSCPRRSGPAVAGPAVLVGPGPLAGAIDRSTCRQCAGVGVVPALVLFVFELPNPATLGVRYLLPSLALWTVLASPVALVVGRRSWPLALWPSCWPRQPTAASCRSRIRSPTRRPRSGPAIGWPPTPTWTGVRTSRCWPPGAGAIIRLWPTSGHVGLTLARHAQGPAAGRRATRPTSRVGWPLGQRPHQCRPRRTGLAAWLLSGRHPGRFDPALPLLHASRRQPPVRPRRPRSAPARSAIGSRSGQDR